jgi:aerobic-type carbon monoxide dehydrogenase small subunit (CoxS/CutS family)
MIGSPAAGIENPGPRGLTYERRCLTEGPVMIALVVNGTRYEVDVEQDVPLLWVLREHLGLTGTKFGCGKAICGSCTVHIDGRAARSCATPVGSVAGKTVTTIEGLSADHPVKRAWVTGEVVQCGYCQPGQIMQAASLFAENPRPSEEQIVKAMDRNLCRCGTYPRILAALVKLAGNGGAP